MPKYSRIERERRYLLTEAPPSMDEQVRIITDLYVSESTLRLREMRYADGRVEYKFGQKKVIDPYRREMTTLYITEDEYRTLSSLTGRRLSKRRYSHRAANGHIYEINVFDHPHRGLVIAEIEFEGDADLDNAPDPPLGWIEITSDPRYDGGNLAS